MNSDKPQPDEREAIQRVLVARAGALAQPLKLERAVDSTGVIVVRVGRERYGLPLRQVREVRALSALTPVPGTPLFWAGLINLRGRLCPVLDLARYLTLPASDAPGSRELVVVTAAGLEVALMVDDVLSMRDVLKGEIGPLLADMAGMRSGVIAGVTPDLLAMLDLDVLLGDPRLVVQSDAN